MLATRCPTSRCICNKLQWCKKAAEVLQLPIAEGFFFAKLERGEISGGRFVMVLPCEMRNPGGPTPILLCCYLASQLLTKQRELNNTNAAKLRS